MPLSLRRRDVCTAAMPQGLGIHHAILCPAFAKYSDCRSLCDRLNAETLAKVSDKRRRIEFMRTCGRDLRGPGAFSRTEEIVLTGSALTRC